MDLVDDFQGMNDGFADAMETSLESSGESPSVGQLEAIPPASVGSSHPTGPAKASSLKARKLAKFRQAVLATQAHPIHDRSHDVQARVEVLGTEIDNFTWEEFLGRLDRGIVFTPNVDHLMTLRKDPEFRAAYAQADYRVCDSQVLLYASRFLGKPLQAKISGSDLLGEFCKYHSHHDKMKIFLLGGAEGVASKAQENLNARYGRALVVGAHSPSFGFEHNEQECQEILARIRASGANVLVVGVGAPKQEKWIVKYRDQLPTIDIFMGLGATLDFEAGNKPRSPKIMSTLGLEWLHRLSTEPRRLWKRYLLKDMPFLWLLVRQKLTR